MASSTSVGSVEYDVKVNLGQLNSELAKADGSVKNFANSADEGGQKIGRSFLSAAKTTLAFGGTYAVFAGVKGAISSVIGSAGDFQQSLNVLQSVTNATGGQMTVLQAKARALGNDLSLPGVSASDAANAMTELAKAGLGVNDVMSASKGVLSLAKAGQLDVADAATITARALNTFGLTGDRATQVADLLAAGANSSTASVQDMAFALAQGGAGAKQFKISIGDTVTALALFSNAGINGSDAGTSLKTMLQSLANPTDGAASKMRELGLKFFDAKGNFVGLQSAAGQLQTSLGKLTVEQRNAALATIFGSDSSRVAGILAAQGATGFEKMAAAVNKQGAAADLAHAQNKGLNGAIDNVKSVLETMATDIGLKLAPALTGALGGIAAFLPRVEELGMGFADRLAGGFNKRLAQVKIIGSLLADKLQAGDYAGAGAQIVTGLLNGFKGVLKRLDEIVKVAGIQLGKLDWVGMGITLGSKIIPGLVLGIAAGLFNIDIGSLFKGVAAHWSQILIAVFSLALVPAKIVRVIGEALARVPLAGPLLRWGLLGAKAFSDTVLSFFTFIPRRLLAGLIRGMDDIKPGLIASFINSLSVLPSVITGIAGLIKRDFGIALENAGEALAEAGPRYWVLQIRASIDSLLTSIRNSIGEFVQSGGQMILGIANGIRSMFMAPVNAFLDMKYLIQAYLSDSASFLFNRGIDLLIGLGNGIRAMFAAPLNAILDFKALVGAYMGDASRLLYGRGLELVLGIRNGIGAALGWAIDGAVAIKNTVFNAIGNLSGLLYGAGRDLVSGLVNGIANNGGAVIRKIEDICRGALNAVKSFFGIHSPSRVMGQMGSYLMQGLAGGIAGSGGLAINAMNDVSKNLGLESPAAASMRAMSSGTTSSGTSAIAGKSVVINQNNVVNTQVDMDKVTSDLAWRAMR